MFSIMHSWQGAMSELGIALHNIVEAQDITREQKCEGTGWLSSNLHSHKSGAELGLWRQRNKCTARGSDRLHYTTTPEARPAHYYVNYTV
jgi:hypothetical protein